MITAYRRYESQTGTEWRLFSSIRATKHALNDVRSWLDSVGHGSVAIKDIRRVAPGFGPVLHQSMVVEDPPEELKMLIKLSFPDVMSVVLRR